MKHIIAKWSDFKNLVHSGVYPLSSKKELMATLDKWLFENKIHSYDIQELKEDIIINC